jgi:hypothetical protein
MDGHQWTNWQCRRSLPILSIEFGHSKKYNWHLMRLIAHSLPILKAHYGPPVKGQHSGTQLAGHLKDILDCFERTDSCLLGITTNNASSNNVMACKLHTTLVASGIDWCTFRNHIPCIAHVIPLALSAFLSCLGVKCCAKVWKAHERDQQFWVNECTDIEKSQRL